MAWERDGGKDSELSNTRFFERERRHPYMCIVGLTVTPRLLLALMHNFVELFVGCRRIDGEMVSAECL